MTKYYRESLTRDERRLIRRGGLLPGDMRMLLEREKVRLQLFTEARLRELTTIVEGYEKGTLTWDQVDKQWDDYEDRWNEHTPLTKDHKLWVKIENQSDAAIGLESSPEFDAHARKLKRLYEKAHSRSEERSR